MHLNSSPPSGSCFLNHSQTLTKQSNPDTDFRAHDVNVYYILTLRNLISSPAFTFTFGPCSCKLGSTWCTLEEGKVILLGVCSFNTAGSLAFLTGVKELREHGYVIVLYCMFSPGFLEYQLHRRKGAFSWVM